MAVKKIGVPDLKRQAGAKVKEDASGLISGMTTYIGDVANVGAAPDIDDPHPEDSRLLAYEKSITYLAQNKVQVDVSYIGLSDTTTDPVSTYSGGSGQQSITTHPNFINFAGDPTITDSSAIGYCAPIGNTGYSQGRNGSRFDATTGQFIGFMKPGNVKAGMTDYLKTGDQVAVTYYTTSSPNYNNRNKVYNVIPHDVEENTNVVSWLLIDMPVTEIGGLTKIYKVTELYLGSDEVEGWDTDVYSSSSYFQPRDPTTLEPSDGLDSSGGL